ncbi:MAG: DUF5667 domain-containing protein [Coriobacteriia bacterium]|nr:DUF5667 domain-containing protein [Coriobacteriia bacterium]
MARFDAETHEWDVVAQVVLRSAAPLSIDRKRAIRARVMSHVDHDALPVRGLTVFRRAMAMITITATVLGGTSYAAAVSLPGDPFYGIKRFSENVTLQVLPDGDMQRHFLFTIAMRRADELARMTNDGADDELMLRAFEQFRVMTSAAYGEDAMSAEESAYATRLREHVESTPQPIRTELQEALDNADPTVSNGSPAGNSMQGSDVNSGSSPDSPGTGDAPAASPETTGPSGMSRP